METHKASKPAFDVGQQSVCRWADDDPLLVVFESSLPSSTKNVTFWQIFLDPHMYYLIHADFQ